MGGQQPATAAKEAHRLTKRQAESGISPGPDSRPDRETFPGFSPPPEPETFQSTTAPTASTAINDSPSSKDKDSKDQKTSTKLRQHLKWLLDHYIFICLVIGCLLIGMISAFSLLDVFQLINGGTIFLALLLGLSSFFISFVKVYQMLFGRKDKIQADLTKTIPNKKPTFRQKFRASLKKLGERYGIALTVLFGCVIVAISVFSIISGLSLGMDTLNGFIGFAGNSAIGGLPFHVEILMAVGIFFAVFAFLSQFLVAFKMGQEFLGSRFSIKRQIVFEFSAPGLSKLITLFKAPFGGGGHVQLIDKKQKLEFGEKHSFEGNTISIKITEHRKPVDFISFGYSQEFLIEGGSIYYQPHKKNQKVMLPKIEIGKLTIASDNNASLSIILTKNANIKIVNQLIHAFRLSQRPENMLQKFYHWLLSKPISRKIKVLSSLGTAGIAGFATSMGALIGFGIGVAFPLWGAILFGALIALGTYTISNINYEQCMEDDTAKIQMSISGKSHDTDHVYPHTWRTSSWAVYAFSTVLLKAAANCFPILARLLALFVIVPNPVPFPIVLGLAVLYCVTVNSSQTWNKANSIYMTWIDMRRRQKPSLAQQDVLQEAAPESLRTLEPQPALQQNAAAPAFSKASDNSHQRSPSDLARSLSASSDSDSGDSNSAHSDADSSTSISDSPLNSVVVVNALAKPSFRRPSQVGQSSLMPPPPPRRLSCREEAAQLMNDLDMRFEAPVAGAVA